MKTDKDFLSNSVTEYQNFELSKMNTSDSIVNSSSSDCEQNTSLMFGDSGYITHYNNEIQTSSTNSSGMSSDDMYPTSKVNLSNEIPVQKNIYFCENAVFDNPKLEGPPILSEDISIDLNKFIQPPESNIFNLYENTNTNLFRVQTEVTTNLFNNNVTCTNESDDTVIENSCSNPNSEVFTFDKLKLSAEKSNVEQISNSENFYSVENQITCCDSTTTTQTCIYTDFSDSKTQHSFISSVAPSLENCSLNSGNELIFRKLENPVYIENLRTETNLSYISTCNLLDSTDKITLDSFTTDSQTRDEFTANKQQSENFINVGKTKSNLDDGINILTKNQLTPNKPIINIQNPDISPELFSDEEEIVPQPQISVITHKIVIQSPIIQNEHMLRNDRKLLRRVQEAISGVPPPPSVTILQTTVSDMLEKIHNNKHLFMTDIFGTGEVLPKIESEKNVKSFLIMNKEEDFVGKGWQEIINYRYHGLHYNRTKISEDFEFYCQKYATRFVGVETASSCTVWSTNLPNSATKRRNARMKWGVKSPGRRLSHLAKRRITFSSLNLQGSSSTNMSVIGAGSSSLKQLVIDTRKQVPKRRSPWQKSPRKSPRKTGKTPNSSSKKASRKLFTNDDPQPGPSRMVSTKRALFQSPDHNRSTTSSASKSKRNLFISPRKNSPAKLKNSPMKSICDKKRKRQEEELHPNKFPRSLSFDTHHSSALKAQADGVTLTRRHSEMAVGNTKRGELSDLHKKKLLWAVSEALRSQQIGMSHPKFRSYAPVLCKVVKHLMPDLMSNGPRQPGSTSDRMLRIARQHVFAVTRGKTYEEIIQTAKEQIDNLKNLKQPVGYVPPESHKSEDRANCVLQDKSLNIENNQKAPVKSPVTKRTGRDENSKARIKRQIIFDDVDVRSNR